MLNFRNPNVPKDINTLRRAISPINLKGVCNGKQNYNNRRTIKYTKKDE